ncbi:TldD protein [Brucella melitensis]|nr:TldD protein [Brucella melitensis]
MTARLPSAAGSLTIDDEGTPTNRTVLIEDGKLFNYMQDRQNARLMGMEATGNGRRESYAHAPMPRMTNTYMLSGDKTPEEIIASIRKGIYAVSLRRRPGGYHIGQVVFGCTEAYMIEDGKVGAPIKGRC